MSEKFIYLGFLVNSVKLTRLVINEKLMFLQEKLKDVEYKYENFCFVWYLIVWL